MIFVPFWRRILRATHNISRPGYLPKFPQILHAPRKATLQLHRILRLPRKVTFKHHCSNITKYYACHKKWQHSNCNKYCAFQEKWLMNLLFPFLLFSPLLFSTLPFSTRLFSTLLFSSFLYSTLITLLYSSLLYSSLLSHFQTPELENFSRKLPLIIYIHMCCVNLCGRSYYAINNSLRTVFQTYTSTIKTKCNPPQILQLHFKTIYLHSKQNRHITACIFSFCGDLDKWSIWHDILVPLAGCGHQDWLRQALPT